MTDRLDPRVATLLDAMEARWAREQAEQATLSKAEAYARVDSYLLPVGPQTGRLMHDLILAGRPATIVEVGTSWGYSTLWLADAARAVGALVISLEIHPAKVTSAAATLASAGLEGVVRFVEGDALESLDRLDRPVDFALIDLWKTLYVPCFDRLADRLSPGALVIADNMIFPPESAADAAAYRQRVHGDARFESVLLPIGAGIEISRRRPDGPA